MSKLLKEPATVTIAGKSYPYEKIKNGAIQLSGEWFFKDDTVNLVKIPDQSGKLKFFRKKSGLIKEISPGVFVHRSNIVHSADGIPLDKTDKNVTMFNGHYIKRDYLVDIDGKSYLRSDQGLTVCKWSGESIRKEKSIKLNAVFYGADAYVSTAHMAQVVERGKPGSGDYILRSNHKLLMEVSGDIVVKYSSEITFPVTSVFHKFKDETNPQLDRIDHISFPTKDADVLVVHPETGVRLHKTQLESFEHIYKTVIAVQLATETKKIKAALVYSDDGPDENQATNVKKIPQPWPGKANIYTPKIMDPVVSRTAVKTGGIRYMFGVEIETAQGLVPNTVLDPLGLKAVGDRSIGSAEYVTAPLHGDNGIDLLEEQCKAIAKYCFVDDKCGIHVHVGGMKDHAWVSDPTYDKNFAINAIKLGCMIEPDLYATCPPNRLPTYKHCHSILRWRDINMDNWKKYIGSYVFGPKESWSASNEQGLWGFDGYEYGANPNMSKSQKLDNWCGGRYKWLNFVHVFSKSNINTVELRLFAGSSNFDKIYNYVLTSLAFVWYVENCSADIQKGTATFEKMITVPFIKLGKPEIAERLQKFYKKRTAKFARTLESMYPATIPLQFADKDGTLKREKLNFIKLS